MEGKAAIILIDDEKTVLDSLISQVKGWYKGQYLFECAQSIEEAWEVLEEFVGEGTPVKLIISDWLMGPDKGHLFLCDVHKKHPEISLIMLSGYADEDSVEFARKNANLHAYIRKPWDENELHKILDQVLKN